MVRCGIACVSSALARAALSIGLALIVIPSGWAQDTAGRVAEQQRAIQSSIARIDGAFETAAAAHRRGECGQFASARASFDQRGLPTGFRANYGDAAAREVLDHKSSLQARLSALGPCPPTVAAQTPAATTGSIATLIFEGGGLQHGGAEHNASCGAACPARPGQNASADARFMGVAVQFNLFALLSTLNRQPVAFTDSFLMAGPFFGVRVRHYFNYRGEEIGFDFHPTPGIDTFLAYSALYSYKTYLGMQFIWLNPLGATQIGAIGISPYVGANFERGQVRVRADESGGGGGVNIFQSSVNRTGTAVGVDLDFYFRNVPFFIGLGLQWDFMPEVAISGTSSLGIAYAASIASRTDFTAAARIGIPLGGIGAVASDMRLKRDIALVGRHADGINLYRYRYLWSDQIFVGVMAQEVEAVMPQAVMRGEDGYLRVAYDQLGLRLTKWEEWEGQVRH
jgi:hypothetical protein